MLTAGLADQLAEATRLITTGDAPACAALVERTRKSHAAALLAARLCREAARRAIAPDASSSAPVLLEMATGGPTPASWLADQAARLADICRYTEESLTAKKLGAKDRAQALLTFVNARAAE